MAHYKRGKCRYQGKGRSYSWRNWPSYWCSTYPRWHDILFHTRPRRMAEAEIERAILAGKVDPDDTAWPLEHKPHKYYW